jgi:hypothetical protein
MGNEANLQWLVAHLPLTAGDCQGSKGGGELELIDGGVRCGCERVIRLDRCTRRI